jgi:hypothetical protein
VEAHAPLSLLLLSSGFADHKKYPVLDLLCDFLTAFDVIIVFDCEKKRKAAISH